MRRKIDRIGYGSVLNFVNAGQGQVESEDIEALRLFAKANQLPFTADTEAEAILRSLPAREIKLEETRVVVENRWATVAKTIKIIAALAAALGLLYFVGSWGPQLIKLLAAAFAFGIRFALAVVVGGVLGVIGLVISAGALAWKRRRAYQFSVQKARLGLHKHNAVTVANVTRIDRAA